MESKTDIVVLNEKLEGFLKIKPARYITSALLGKELVEQLNRHTSFLQPEHGLQERIYCIINNISEHPKCPCCDKEVDRWHKFDDHIDAYRNHFCSAACTRTYQSRISNFTMDQSLVVSKDRLKEKLDAHYAANNNYRTTDPVLISSTLFHLKQMNIDYSKFGLSQAYRFISEGLAEIPRCPTCGGEVNYHEGKLKWETYCSSKCGANSSSTVEKRGMTNMEKYGVVNVFQSKEIKEKSDGTRERKYGDKNFRNRDKAKIKTYVKTYNDFARFRDICVPLFDISEFKGCSYDVEYRWRCSKCGLEFIKCYINGNVPLCPDCYKLLGGNSNAEKEVAEYISGLLGRDKVVIGSKKVIPPRQLDAYIPSMNIAFEYDGLYWHSAEHGYDRKYHLAKTNACLEKDIRLIHIFEDEWIYRNRIVRNRIKSILGMTRYSIYARKCKVMEITNELKDKFLDKYHIQGSDMSPIRLGLFYGTRMVAAMTFSKNRHMSGECGYELVRYASIASFNIVGGAGKLLSYFEKNYRPPAITTYADRRWSMGNLYEKLGFTLSHDSPPNYWYFKSADRIRQSREKFQKHKLKDILPIFNPGISEAENMRNAGYYRIYDCGNMVFKKFFQ
jgi:hypothetical protein